MNNFEYVKLLIKQLSGKENSIAVNISFMKYMGSLEGGAFLSQMVYWSDKSKREDGFFYKTYKDWHDELYLSEHTVRKLTKKLTEKGFLETKLKKANGSPTIHYKLDFELFCQEFIGFLKNEDSILNKSTLENENVNNGKLKSEVSLTEITTKTTTKTNNTNNNLPVENVKEEKVGKKSKYKYEEFDMNMANLLLTLMKENNPTFNDSKTNLESWANELRLLRTADLKEEKTIEYLLRWCQGHHFWKTNILSAKTFREKWDRLYMQSKEEYERKQKNNSYNSYQQNNQAPRSTYDDYDKFSI